MVDARRDECPHLCLAGNAIERAGEVEVAPGGPGEAAESGLVGRQRIEASHHDLEQAVARLFALGRPAGKHRSIHPFGEIAKDGDLAVIGGAQRRQRNARLTGNVGKADIAEIARREKRHQRVDDPVAGIVRAGGTGRLCGRRLAGRASSRHGFTLSY